MFRLMLTCWLLASSSLAHCAMGLIELPASAIAGPVTVFYPTSEEEHPLSRGPFAFEAALDAPPQAGNRTLVIISHGSPGCPWTHVDLARTLVAQGFIVALPEHLADNSKDGSDSGPESWKRRPVEVSNAIDALAQAPQFSALLQFDRVGMFGMSAGGHTALSLAGGRWSPERFREHCQRNIEADFQACVGPITHLTGGALDGMKTAVAKWVINMKFDDERGYEHHDPRIKAVVAGVPFAADFDPASLAEPKAHLAIISARRDIWLVPRYHSDVILQACSNCVHLADLANAGHGALLSPLPPGRTGLLAELTADPPDFDRAKDVARINQQIADYFQQSLVLAAER